MNKVDVLVEMQADIDELEQRVLAGEFALSRGYDKVNRLRSIHAAVAELIERDERSERLIEVLRHERDHARRCYDGAVKTLAGIHALLYPPPHTNAEGVTFVFHSPHVHEQMQALSDRIRAIPNEISTIGSAK